MFISLEEKVSTKLVCSRCGSIVHITWRFCAKCGEGMWDESDKDGLRAKREYLERISE